MRDRIEIKKSLIPYNFDIPLPDELYAVSVSYNETGDLFVIKLSKDGEILCSGEPLIYGVPLFEDIANDKFPKIVIMPLDESENYNRVTFNNFNDTVFLTVSYGGSDE
jgi:hypothetical protein